MKKLLILSFGLLGTENVKAMMPDRDAHNRPDTYYHDQVQQFMELMKAPNQSTYQQEINEEQVITLIKDYCTKHAINPATDTVRFKLVLYKLGINNSFLSDRIHSRLNVKSWLEFFKDFFTGKGNVQKPKKVVKETTTSRNLEDTPENRALYNRAMENLGKKTLTPAEKDAIKRAPESFSKPTTMPNLFGDPMPAKRPATAPTQTTLSAEFEAAEEAAESNVAAQTETAKKKIQHKQNMTPEETRADLTMLARKTGRGEILTAAETARLDSHQSEWTMRRQGSKDWKSNQQLFENEHRKALEASIAEEVLSTADPRPEAL